MDKYTVDYTGLRRDSLISAFLHVSLYFFLGAIVIDSMNAAAPVAEHPLSIALYAVLVRNGMYMLFSVLSVPFTPTCSRARILAVGAGGVIKSE